MKILLSIFSVLLFLDVQVTGIIIIKLTLIRIFILIIIHYLLIMHQALILRWEKLLYLEQDLVQVMVPTIGLSIWVNLFMSGGTFVKMALMSDLIHEAIAEDSWVVSIYSTVKNDI